MRRWSLMPDYLGLLLAGVAWFSTLNCLAAEPALTHADKVALMQLARNALLEKFNATARHTVGKESLAKLKAMNNRVFVVFRNNGKCRGCWSGAGGSLAENVVQAVERTLRDSRYGGPLQRGELRNVRLEVLVLLNRKEIRDKSIAGLSRSLNLGLDSIELRKGKKGATFLSYVPITYGYRLKKLLDRLCIKARLVTPEIGSSGNLDVGELAERILADPAVRLYKVPTIHLLESYDSNDVVELYRCNVLVPTRDVNKTGVRGAIQLCGQWLLNSIRWNGRLEYMWYPLRGKYSTKNNMIRQWMATNALWDMYQFTRDERYRRAARRNLLYNIRNYYREEKKKGMGLILFRNMTKTGAVGLALSAIVRIDEEGQYKTCIEGLKRFLLAMRRADGSFQPIYPSEGVTPERARRLERYYSGEAMLGLMRLYAKTREALLLETVKKSFAYHKAFYARDGHPAAIPWLTQAFYQVHRYNPDPAYAHFIFEMNDLVVSIQELSTGEPDKLGRFYDPRRREYGPPLSASTGVYIEGLVDAYRLAKEYGDKERAERYRRAIILGIRSLMQLQYKGDNLFFIQNPILARGGIRSTVHGTTIRIDYTQHAMQGMIKAINAIHDWNIDL